MLNELQFDVAPAAAPSVRPALAPEETRAECEQRMAVYRLLAGVFVEEPSVEFLAALRAPESMAALAQAGLNFDDDFLRPDLDALAEALACEYTTLFAASGGFPPVESVRLTGRYQQALHFDVKQTYRRAGFAVRTGRFKVIEDHLGIELLFVAELLERSIGALDRGDLAGYRALERDIKRFWTLHLGRWVRGYCRLVERAAEHSLYREMARLLAGFAAEEIAALRLRIDDLDRGREVVPKSEVQIAFNPDEPVCNACGPAAAAPLPPGSIPLELRTGVDAARPG